MEGFAAAEEDEQVGGQQAKLNLGFGRIEGGEGKNRRRGESEPEPVPEMAVEAGTETEERGRQPDLGA